MITEQTEVIDAITFDGFTRKEIARKLKISPDRLRQITRDLRRVLPEFEFLPGDRLITPKDEKILMKFWRLAKTKTFSRALDHVRKYGI